MICPGSDLDCDNPGCRRGGCQGRRPKLPLFRASVGTARGLPLLDAEIEDGTTALQAAEPAASRRRLVVA